MPTEEFDKRIWTMDITKMKKDYLAEDRARFMPLLRIKKEVVIKEFMEEVERTEKKNEIGVMRERG